MLLAWKKLQVAGKNCSVERISREVTLTRISISNYCAIVIVSEYFISFYTFPLNLLK